MKKFLANISDAFRKVGPARFFVIVAALFGIIFVLITPPVAGLDEEQHFYRAYQVSDLTLNSKFIEAPNVYGEPGEGYGGYLPVSVFEVINKLRNSMSEDKSYQYRVIKANLDIPLNPENKQGVRFDNTAIYSGVAYAPQALGIAAGKLFNLSPTILSYLGRLATLTFFIIAVYFAIKIIPRGKWILVVLALNPASLFLASSLSSDAVSIALVALFVATVIRASVAEKLSKKYIVGLLLLALSIALLKNAYMPIILFILLIPSATLRLRIKIILIGISLAVGMAWNLSILPIAGGIPDYFSIDLHIASGEQISHIIHNPLFTVGVVLWNLFGMPSTILSQDFAGLTSDTKLPFWATLLWFMTLAATVFLREKPTNDVVDSKKFQWRTMLIVVAVVAAIVGSLYVGWNEVGSREITGIQARYFIPVSFLLIPILLYIKPRLANLKQIRLLNYIKAALLLGLIVTVLTMCVRYLYGII